MKLSLNWLQKYIDHGLTAQELSTRMTMAGLEIEHMEHVDGDVVFEIEITPNRPDCLSVLGLAREVSAIVDKDLNIPDHQEYEDCADVSITIENKEDCFRYIGALIEQVDILQTPQEYASLLQALKLKPICNVVDLSNFVMFECGQPLHAFDYDKIEGGRIVVRRAKKGEKIVTLDDVERVLDETILVIADAKKPIAIAGIMGGRDTAVTQSTKRVLIESAQFDLGIIRRGSRKLGLTSDSCYRFERGVSYQGVERACYRMIDLVLKTTKGKIVAKKDVVIKEASTLRKEIVVTKEKIQKLLGCCLEKERVIRILKRLGCIVVSHGETFSVVTPYFRNDLNISEDVIEEMARVIGYDQLPMSLPRISAINIPVHHEKDCFNQKVSDMMVSNGFNEVVSYSLISSHLLEKTGYESEVIKLQNPMSGEQELMRPTAFPGLLQIAVNNMNRGQKDLKIFEVGKKYLPQKESWVLSILMTGVVQKNWKQSKKITADFYDLKGVVENLLKQMRVSDVFFQPIKHETLEEGQTANIFCKSVCIGVIGKVSDQVVNAFDIKKSKVFVAELELDLLKDLINPRERFQDLVEFPVMIRDVSFAIKKNAVCLDEMKQLCFNEGQGLLQKIDFVELYTGDKIDTNFSGYVMSFLYQAKNRTLTDQEVNTLHERLIQKLITTFDISRR